MDLKVAADRLYFIDHPLRDDENALSLIGPYNMLMGLVFENLLKGIILLNQLEDIGTPGLPKKCFHHRIDDLFTFLGDFEHCLNDKEKSHIISLSPYIEWAGRYHLPKKKEDIILVSHGNMERELELSSWEKLYSYLLKEAWVMKGGSNENGGYRLYFDSNKNPHKTVIDPGLREFFNQKKKNDLA
jgi:hypothetical protein